MPGSRPLFQPLSRDSATGGQPLLPDLSSVLGSSGGFEGLDERRSAFVADQEQENKAWWLKSLEFIEGLTGGQAIKGLLAGTGEEGLGDNLEEFLLKNPLFQITDAIGLTDLTGDRVEFTDVRVNFGQDPEQVEEGFGNFMFNLVGSVITDPGSFLLPLGLTKTGVAAAGNAAKVGATVGKAAAPAALRTASLVKSVENGYRAAAVFKLWGVPGRLVIPTPKSLNLALAHTLEGVGNLLHTNGVTGPILSRFSAGTLRLGSRRIKLDPTELAEFQSLRTTRGAGTFGPGGVLHGEDLIRTGSEARRAFKLTRMAGNEQARKIMSITAPALSKVLNDTPEILENAAAGRTMTRFLETGVSRGGLNEDFGVPLAGLDLLDDKARSLVYVTTQAFNRRAVLRGAEAAKERGIEKLYASARAGKAEAIDSIMLDHADLALPTGTLEARFGGSGKGLRAGIDIQDFDVVRRDRDIQGLFEEGGELGTAGTKGRKEVEEIISPSARKKGRDEVIDEAERDFDKMLAEAKDPEDLLNRMLGSADDMRDILDTLGEAEKSAGLLNTALAGYFPRGLTPDMGKLLNDRFKAFVGNQGKAAIDAAGTFMKHRQFTELSIFDVNWIARNMGLNFMGHAKLNGFDKSAMTGAQQVMDKVFNNSFIRGFKEKFFGAADEEGGKAYEEMIQLFETNPMNATYQRMKESADALSTHRVTAEIFSKDSIFVDFTYPLNHAKSAELQQLNTHVGVMTDKSGRFGMKTPGSVFRSIMTADDTSAAYIARNRISNEVRQNLMGDVTHYDRTVDLLQNAGDLPLDAPESLLVRSDHDLSSIMKLKAEIKGLQSMKARAAGLTGEAKEKLLDQIQFAEKINIHPVRAAARDHANVLKAMRDDLVDATERKAGNREIFGKRERLVSGMTEGQRAQLQQTVKEGTNSAAMDQRLKIILNQKERGFSTYDELKELSPTHFAKMSKEQVHWMRKEHYSAIFGEGGGQEMLKSPDKMAHTLRGFDKWQRWWKGWTVVPWPQSRFRDTVSNYMLLQQGGISNINMLSSVVDSAKVTHAFRKISKGGTDTLDAMQNKFIKLGGGREISMADLYTDFQARLGMGSAHTMEEMQFQAGQQLQLMKKQKGFLKSPVDFAKRFANILPSGQAGHPIFRAGYTLTEYGDSMPKVMGYLAELKSGKTAAEAAANVRAWTYSPDNMLTSFERHTVTRSLPFYRWMKFALATEVGAAMARPGTVSVWQKIYENAHKGVGVESSDLDVIRPEWMADKMGIPFRKSKKGFDFLVGGAFIPFGEVVDLANTVGKVLDPEDENSLLNYLGNRMTPPLKLAIESLRNESFFTERAIEQFPGQTAEFMVWDLPKTAINVMRNIRFLAEVDKLKIFTPEEMEGLVKVSAEKRVDRPLLQRFLESGFSIVPKLQDLDVGRQARFKGFELSKKGAKSKGLLKKAKREGTSPAQVQTLIGQLAQIEAEKKKLLRVRRAVR